MCSELGTDRQTEVGKLLGLYNTCLADSYFDTSLMWMFTKSVMETPYGWFGERSSIEKLKITWLCLSRHGAYGYFRMFTKRLEMRT
jgi:hypothetical protein